MFSDMDDKRPCTDCQVLPGSIHKDGCDVERCRICGGQAISCDCIYIFHGLDADTMEASHPDIYRNGPTEQMSRAFDEYVDKFGGRLPWTGVWPGVAECQEFGWYSKLVPGEGWKRVEDKNDKDATEDLNRLGMSNECYWSPKDGRYLLSRNLLISL